jgi:tetratricopeptide (TPR) repeat protein
VLSDQPSSGLRRAFWPLAGLALCAHITAPLLILPLAVAAWLRSARQRGVLVLALICAGVLCYVPLASLRDSAFDWGDPQTLERWFRHLSAARIREAYEAALFTRDDLPRLRLVEQLTEQPYWLPLALVGVLGVARQQRKSALVLGLLLCLDLAYASWINPMGVAQRQVGHASVAVIALFAGCGCALLVELLPMQLRPAGRLGVAMISCACLWSVGRALLQSPASDGYAVSERYGAASPLSELAPRAVYLCETDSACASALFAVYAEGIRPDLDVVPAQHLWDPTVLRRLRELPLMAAADAQRWPAAAERGTWAERRQRELFRQADRRPLYTERLPREQGAAALGLQHAPFIRIGADGSSELDRLAKLEHARFGAAGPTSTLARELWASAHETLGAVGLASGRASEAVAEFSRAVALTPLRAAARSNLGVALERRGDLHAALQQTAQAVELDPLRPTPWVNLTRLLLRTQGPAAARTALVNAKRYEVSDPRLDALTRELQLPADPEGMPDATGTSGTTRK